MNSLNGIYRKTSKQNNDCGLFWVNIYFIATFFLPITSSVFVVILSCFRNILNYFRRNEKKKLENAHKLRALFTLAWISFL